MNGDNRLDTGAMDAERQFAREPPVEICVLERRHTTEAPPEGRHESP